MQDSASSGGSAGKSTMGRVFGWAFNWRTPGQVALKLAILAVLMWAFCAEENWRGKRDWEVYKGQLEAKGMELDWKKYIPPTVPDAQNFAMTPFLAPMFDFNPRPLQPGQSSWRDTDGWARITNYAAALNPTNEFWKGEPDQPARPMTDLEDALLILQRHANPDAAKPVFSTRADAASAVLAAFEEFKPVLEELRAASQRPYCRYNVDYSYDNPMEILVPHLGVIRRVNRLLQIRASAELELGKTDDAFADAGLMLFLAGSLSSDSFLISHGVRLTVMRSVDQIVWEGLAEHRWSDAQLREFQSRLQKITVLADLKKPLMVESAAFGIKLFDYIRSHPNGFRNMLAYNDGGFWASALLVAPTGWLYQEEISCQRLYHEKMLQCFDAESAQIHPRIVDDIWTRLERQKTRGFSSFLHHEVLSQMLMPNLFRLFQNTAVTQAGIDQAELACTLERYRIAEGRHPEALADLAPRFIDRLPPDVCSGQPLKYRRENDGFVLYSVGWNEKDDGGTAAMNKSDGMADLNQGDWVWPRYPDRSHGFN